MKTVPSLLLALAATIPLAAASTPSVKPEDVGLSSARLQRITQMIERRIAAGDIAGAVTVVARRGRIAHVSAQGVMDLETTQPMSAATMFRIASMTKPVIGTSIMMLVEEGKLHLNDLADHASGRLAVPADTLDTGNADRDADMRKALGTPDITCELLGFEKGDARVRFTIHGEAREMTVPVELTFDKGLLHVKGEAKLLMSDYGVKVKSAALGMVSMEDEVTMWWDLYAEVVRDAAR